MTSETLSTSSTNARKHSRGSICSAPVLGEPVLENHASRPWTSFLLAVVDQRWDDVTARIAEDFEMIDTREGSSLELDKQGMLDNSQVMLNLGFVVGDSRRDVLATRGESFVLTRLRMVASNDFELEILYEVEIDDEGRFVRVVGFGPDAIGAAFADLDERFVAKLPRTEAPMYQGARDLVTAVNSRDFDAVVRMVTRDFVLRDRRSGPAVPDRRGVADASPVLLEQLELVPDSRFTILGVPKLAADRAVLRLLLEGTSPSGGHVEYHDLYVAHVLDGKMTVLERFDAEDIDKAVARFEELGVDHPPENLATRTSRVYWTYVRDGDEEKFADVLAPDYRFIDRRLGLAEEHDKATNVAQARMLAREGAGFDVDLEILASRGDHFCLFRQKLTVADSGFEVEMLCLQEADDEGRFLLGVMFDVDDLDAAHAELDGLATKAGE